MGHGCCIAQESGFLSGCRSEAQSSTATSATIAVTASCGGEAGLAKDILCSLENNVDGDHSWPDATRSYATPANIYSASVFLRLAPLSRQFDASLVIAYPRALYLVSWILDCRGQFTWCGGPWLFTRTRELIHTRE